MIKVYGKENCKQCEEIKALLEKEKFTFTYTDDLKKLREVGSKARIMSAPIIEIDGNMFTADYFKTEFKNVFLRTVLLNELKDVTDDAKVIEVALLLKEFLNTRGIKFEGDMYNYHQICVMMFNYWNQYRVNWHSCEDQFGYITEFYNVDENLEKSYNFCKKHLEDNPDLVWG